MLVWDLVSGVGPQPLAALDIGVDRSALDRTRPDDRDLDRQVLQRLRPGPAQRLHLRTALDLEHAGRVGRLDAVIRGGIVVWDPAEVDPLAAGAGDHLDAALDGR